METYMSTITTTQNSFIKDVWIYASQMKLFTRIDWQVYVAWVGLMLGLLFSVCGFIGLGWFNGVQYPDYVWSVPIGTFIFIGAISFDTIGHRTAYKEELKKGESLVHHITIFAGITSVVLLCLAYHYRDAFRFPALTMVALSIFYSMIDEALHWKRYFELKSDRVEMWSHFFIFVGHTLMITSWVHWFNEGYPGVAETLRYLP